MTDQAAIFQPAIDALEKDMSNLERQWNALLSSVNILREKAGLPPRPGTMLGAGGGDGVSAGRGSPITLQSDSFTGKTMGQAMREYLEMRKSTGGDSPATVREIHDALKQGGFITTAKDDHTFDVMLRTTLRKSSSIFFKLQNGKYGLRVWYPNLRTPRTTDDAEAADVDTEIEEATESDSGTTEETAVA
jgi:hypothetical protein